MKEKVITIQMTIDANLDKVWLYWTSPEHIVNWNFATEDWICPSAINELYPGGKLVWRMEAKDGSVGFDFSGKYTDVREKESIQYQIADGRNVEISFTEEDGQVKIVERFEAEDIHTAEQQRAGWKMILENFKNYTESS